MDFRVPRPGYDWNMWKRLPNVVAVVGAAVTILLFLLSSAQQWPIWVKVALLLLLSLSLLIVVVRNISYLCALLCYAWKRY